MFEGLQLAVSEERHRLLLEHSGIGIGYYDLEGRVILFNGIAAQHMGGRPGDFVGRTIQDLYPEAATEYMQRVRRVAGSDEAHEYEDLVPLPTGERWFQSTYTKVLDAAGRVTGVQILSRDVTEKKKAEVKLREQEQQLRQSQKLEAIGSLAGGVAHDFNNLLSVISGYTDLLLGTLEKGDPARDNLLEVHAASRRASELTRQLFAFSRKQVLEPRLRPR